MSGRVFKCHFILETAAEGGERKEGFKFPEGQIGGAET